MPQELPRILAPHRVQIYDPTEAATPLSQAGIDCGTYGTTNIDTSPYDGTPSLVTTDCDLAAR